jgi:surface protein
MKRSYRKLLFANTLILIGVLLTLVSDAQFITQWQVIGSNEVITIPTTGAGYDYTVNWGDGNTSTATGDVSHTYIKEGTYKVTITGSFPRIYFNDTAADKDKIIDISQWGTNAWKSMNRAFMGCTNLNITASDAPVLSDVTHMSNMFSGCKKLNPTGAAATAMDNWNTESVTNMTGMFYEAAAFNQNTGNWNTANVTDMYAMFELAAAFNQDIGHWNTSNVTNMGNMFLSLGATAFNQDIGNWNTAKVTDMENMFYGATAFNQDISRWNTANVTQMGTMFFGATAFNQDIGHWNTAKVTDMYGMFWGATAFNQDLGNWKISNSPNMLSMLDNSGLSITNYDNTLIGWARQAPSANLVFGAEGLKYCKGADARSKLISTYNWRIFGDSLSCVLPSDLMPKVFPNPTTGLVKISEIQIGDVILLTDVLGQKLVSQSVSNETEILNINFMASGIYLISIMRKGRMVITGKITKLN